MRIRLLALAAILAAQGEFSRAIEIQTEVAAASRGIMKAMDEANLKKYQTAADEAEAETKDAESTAESAK